MPEALCPDIADFGPLTTLANAKSLCLQYTRLPGIIGERFFSVLDLNSSGYIDLKEFVHGLFKVYYSDTETKLKFSFDM